MAGFISAAIIIGTAATATISYMNSKREQKSAEAAMEQQRQMANQQVRMKEDAVQGQAVRSGNRQEKQARAAYGRSDQIGVGTNSIDLLTGASPMEENRGRMGSSLLGG
jgi:hypothetical protein